MKTKYRVRAGEPYEGWYSVQEKRWFLFIPYWKTIESFLNKNPYNTIESQAVYEARKLANLLSEKEE